MPVGQTKGHAVGAMHCETGTTSEAVATRICRRLETGSLREVTLEIEATSGLLRSPA